MMQLFEENGRVARRQAMMLADVLLSIILFTNNISKISIFRRHEFFFTKNEACVKFNFYVLLSRQKIKIFFIDS